MNNKLKNSSLKTTKKIQTTTSKPQSRIMNTSKKIMTLLGPTLKK